ncbi:Gp138 family membrane-puncturing spike protein [Apirhabdus apintestini]|uniref:Gp138 family membrane-puncturing spike protein n=1 Tax=Erwinia sp. HR93 TaxID=3094840 RepID=UPI002ADEDD18|nr:Gp138 family membrane-puncturing spike protein [Erwinia sp. HR93]MEA1064304.1 Gp138 family membrane-puncturing spike protein [Erwinia sp. HR93]WPM85435.1 Gp138 family membrane-puncturing spike protein [Enterobacteriaceae bacterium CA-0114]
MALQTENLSADALEAFSSLAAAIGSELHVALPGIIQSFDSESVTCVVKPSVKGRSMDSGGEVASLDYPLLVDVPVIFPRGGGCTLTFPLREGDECLLLFADRAIDFWWQNGSTQETTAARQHSLSDAFVVPGPQSQARRIPEISATGAQLRTDDGAAFIEVAAAHDIRVETPGKVSVKADGGVDVTSPTVSFSGDVTIQGNLTVAKNATAQGISLVTHTHPGVMSGPNNTGAPQ